MYIDVLLDWSIMITKSQTCFVRRIKTGQFRHNRDVGMQKLRQRHATCCKTKHIFMQHIRLIYSHWYLYGIMTCIMLYWTGHIYWWKLPILPDKNLCFTSRHWGYSYLLLSVKGIWKCKLEVQLVMMHYFLRKIAVRNLKCAQGNLRRIVINIWHAKQLGRDVRCTELS